MMTSKKRIEILEKRIRELELEIRELKQRQSAAKPIPLPTPEYPFEPIRYDPTCSVCGMTFNGPMGYVCMNPGCPSKVTCYTVV